MIHETESCRYCLSDQEIHYMIKAAKRITIIYTNHFVTVFIVHQLSFNIIDVKKLNLCLIHTFKYFQRFHFTVCYKSDKMNIISDVLFYLISCKYQSELNEFSFNVLHSFTVFIYVNNLVKMSSEFHQNLLDDYTKKSH